MSRQKKIETKMAKESHEENLARALGPGLVARRPLDLLTLLKSVLTMVSVVDARCSHYDLKLLDTV